MNFTSFNAKIAKGDAKLYQALGQLKSKTVAQISEGTSGPGWAPWIQLPDNS